MKWNVGPMHKNTHIQKSLLFKVCVCVCVCVCVFVHVCAKCLLFGRGPTNIHNEQEVSKKKKKSVQNALYMGKAGTNRRYSHSCGVCLSSGNELSEIIVTVDSLYISEWCHERKVKYMQSKTIFMWWHGNYAGTVLRVYVGPIYTSWCSTYHTT